MDLRLAIELAIFSFLLFWHLSKKERRLAFFKRHLDDNVVDALSLAIQGILIPILQFVLIFHVFEWLIPGLRNAISLPNWVGFLINFIFVDLLYYLVHRQMHSKTLWGFHLLHHSASEMDVVVSSRNTVWTSFFFPYLWFNSFFVFALENKTGFILGVSLTAMLDLWRHSYLCFNPQGRVFKTLSLLLHTPIHHAWHHSRSQSRVNFGANLCLWDRLFGTYLHRDTFPTDLGFPVKSDLKTKLFFPLRLGRENQ